MTAPTAESPLYQRLCGIRDSIELGMECALDLGVDEWIDESTGERVYGRYYFQIACWRRDAITGEMGLGYGGLGFVNPDASDGQIVQMIHGLYLSYWTHEARETFKWNGRRIYGPHIKLDALYEAAKHIDIPSARHLTDQPKKEEDWLFDPEKNTRIGGD